MVITDKTALLTCLLQFKHGCYVSSVPVADYLGGGGGGWMRTTVSPVSTQYSVNKVQHTFVKNAVNEKNSQLLGAFFILCTVSAEHN